jgi:hypothetical protein
VENGNFGDRIEKRLIPKIKKRMEMGMSGWLRVKMNVKLLIFLCHVKSCP